MIFALQVGLSAPNTQTQNDTCFHLFALWSDQSVDTAKKLLSILRHIFKKGVSLQVLPRDRRYYGSDASLQSLSTCTQVWRRSNCWCTCSSLVGSAGTFCLPVIHRCEPESEQQKTCLTRWSRVRFGALCAQTISDFSRNSFLTQIRQHQKDFFS